MKTGTPRTRALGNVYTNFDFSTFLFSSYEMDRHARRVMWTIKDGLIIIPVDVSLATVAAGTESQVPVRLRM